MSEDKLRYGMCGKGQRYHLTIDPRPTWPMSLCFLRLDETYNSPDAYINNLSECKNCRKAHEKLGGGGHKAMTDESVLTVGRLIESMFRGLSGGRDIIDYPDEQYAFVLYKGAIYLMDKQHKPTGEVKNERRAGRVRGRKGA